QVKNLFHFANLAKSSWREAVQLFYSKQFIQVLSGNDKRYFNVYKGLVKEFGNEQNVEEFLIEINKKQPIEYIVNTAAITVNHPEGVVAEQISITKNGWGYVTFSVQAEGSFCTIEKSDLREEDFLGNQCKLNVYIDAEKMHYGVNYGSVRLLYTGGAIVVPITAVKQQAVHTHKKLQEHALIYDLMQKYMGFRMKKINTAQWIAQSKEIVEKLVHYYERNPIYRLYQAQLLITRERYNEAKWILDHTDEMLQGQAYAPEIICYYKYLTTLYYRDEHYVNEQTEEIELAYRQNPDNWRIAWLLLYLREEYSQNPAKKWMLLEEQYERHNHSPVLYIEAIYLANANPSLLQKLEGFELQILNYAVKHELLDAGLLPQIHYLMQHVRRYSKRLLYLLQYCYHFQGQSETLQEICELLIRNNKTEPTYFTWYALGVEKQLRITRLYEYYMMTLDLTSKEQLPKIVMMYFAYSCNLSYERKAYLYANVLRYQEELPEMLQSYQEQMEQFAVEQLQNGHMNQDLAYLYSHFFVSREMSETRAGLLAPLLFQQLVEVKDSHMKQVVVIHNKLKGETRYPILNGQATIAIYSTDYSLFLEDGEGNRYGEETNYAVHPFLTPGELAKAVRKTSCIFLGMDIYICEGSGDYVVISEETIQPFSRIAESEQVKESYKREIRSRLLHYYFDKDEIRELDQYLLQIQPKGMQEEERAEFIQFMVIRGMYEKALQWIEQYGVEGVKDKTILRLCSRTLIRNDYEENAYLLQLCHYIFMQNRYDEYILTYLVRFYRGTTRELRDIWTAAQNFEVDTFSITERLVIQMLYSNYFIAEGVSIFNSYVSMGGKREIELAYLTHCAYEYFIDDKVLDSTVFSYLTDIIQDDTEVGTVCKLAYLKHYAEHKEQITECEKPIIRMMLTNLWQNRIYFSFFMDYIDIFPELTLLADHTFLEYKSATKGKVWLHYVFESMGKEKTAEYRAEEMQHIYGDIYAKSFMLFFGESVQYYITEGYQEQEELTESGTIRKSDIVGEPRDNKFSVINDLAIAKTLQDYDTIQQLMEEFYQKEYLVEHLFRVI
ncbi:MAG: DUF5717 family protein, partial [Lachnospiraceae bacterium]